MSTICASSYARIFIKNLEAKHIYPYIKEMSLLYLRCIGDIFMICKGSKAELMTFIKELNEKHKTIKVHFQISQRKIVFLDIMLYNDENSKQLYIAKLQMNKHSYRLNQNVQDL